MSSDPFKHSIVSLRSSGSRTGDDMVTQDEVRALLRHSSMLQRHRDRQATRRNSRERNATEGIMANIMESVEFVDDDFEPGPADPQDDTPVLERERTRVIQVVTVRSACTLVSVSCHIRKWPRRKASLPGM